MKKYKIILTIILSFTFFENIYAKNNFFDDGKKLFEKKEIAKSKLKFEKDIVFNPKNEKSYLYLAKIYKLQNNDKLQEQNLNTVILLDPKNEEAIYLLTLLKIKNSDYERSSQLIDTFRKVCINICNSKIELTEKLKNLQPS